MPRHQATAQKVFDLQQLDKPPEERLSAPPPFEVTDEATGRTFASEERLRKFQKGQECETLENFIEREKANKAKGVKPNPGYFAKYSENPAEIGVRCYISGEKYGTASIDIHLKEAEKLFLLREALKPVHLRRPLPARPMEYDMWKQGKLSLKVRQVINWNVYRFYAHFHLSIKTLSFFFIDLTCVRPRSHKTLNLKHLKIMIYKFLF